MASRRSTRSQTASSEPVEPTPRRAVIKAPLPPIPSSINTSYGSPHAALPVALRRRHDLRSAVGSALAAANQPADAEEGSEDVGSDEQDDDGLPVDDEDRDVLPPLRSSRQVTPTPEPGRRRRHGTPSDVGSARSFAQESGIFGDATVLSRGGLGSSSAGRSGEGSGQRLPPLGLSAPAHRADPTAAVPQPAPRRSERLRMPAAAENSPGPAPGRSPGPAPGPGWRARQYLRQSYAAVLRKLSTVPGPHWLYLLGAALFLLFAMSGSRARDQDTADIRFYGWTDLRHNVGQFLPSWMSSSPIHLPAGDEREYLAQLSKFEYDIKYLTKEGKLRKEAIQKLEAMLPDFVHTQRSRSGQIKVPEDFWFALKELIEKDETILTLEAGKRGDDISQRHWAALKKRLEIDGGHAKAGNRPSDKDIASFVDSALEDRLPHLWSKWIKDNDQGVRALLDKVQGAVDQAAKGRLGDDGLKDALVTKKDFIEHLRNEFLEHDSKIKGQLKDMDGRMHQMADALARLASQKQPSSTTGGLTRKDVSAVVDDAFRKAVARAQVEALARGAVQGFWASELSRQVNYFNPGSGAQINRDYASAEYRSAVSGYLGSSSSFSLFSRGGGAGIVGSGGPSGLGIGIGSFIRRLVNANPPVRALSDWSDDGDCWCVWPDRNSKATLGVLLPVPVTPSHLVVEHIDPARTVDPDAMPRDIQLWLRVADPVQREALRGWFGRIHGVEQQMDPEDGAESQTTPPTPYGDDWVEVSRLRYEWRDADAGVLVHRLPVDELQALGATSDRVIVRVMTNHGDDHTCIYRMRLYGMPWNATAV